MRKRNALRIGNPQSAESVAFVVRRYGAEDQRAYLVSTLERELMIGFDDKFCRKDPNGLPIEKWFFPEILTPKEVKSWLSTAFSKLIKASREEGYNRGYQEASEKAGFHFINEEIPVKVKQSRLETLKEVEGIIEKMKIQGKDTDSKFKDYFSETRVDVCIGYNKSLSDLLTEIEKMK